MDLFCNISSMFTYFYIYYFSTRFILCPLPHHPSHPTPTPPQRVKEWCSMLPVPCAALCMCFVFTLLIWSLAVRAVTVISVHHLLPFSAFSLQLQITLNSQTSCGILHRLKIFRVNKRMKSVEKKSEIEKLQRRNERNRSPCIACRVLLCLAEYRCPCSMRLRKGAWLLFMLTASTFTKHRIIENSFHYVKAALMNRIKLISPVNDQQVRKPTSAFWFPNITQTLSFVLQISFNRRHS